MPTATLSAREIYDRLMKASWRLSAQGQWGIYPAALDSALKQAVGEARALPMEEQIALALKCAADHSDYAYFGSHKLLSALLRRKLEFKEPELAELVHAASRWRWGGPVASVLGHVERIGVSPEIRRALAALRQTRYVSEDSHESRKLRERIDKLLAGPQAVEDFRPCGAWSRTLLEGVSSQERGPLECLLRLGPKMSGVAPSRKWLKESAQVVADLGQERFREIALEALGRGPNPGEQAPISPEEGDLQKGLLWSLVASPDREVCAALARFAEQGLKKVPQLGPVAQKSANACIKALSAMEGTEAVAQLSRLAMRVKYATTRRILEKEIDEAAKRNGLTREELAEITVPDYDLSPDGVFTAVLGEYRAAFDVRAPKLRFSTADGKPLRSVPQAVKRESSGELKALRARAKEVAEMLAAQRIRLERLLAGERRISVANWRKRYVEHPLVHDLARRLIWEFRFNDETRTAIWRSSGLREWNDVELTPPDDAEVRLWHPLTADPQTVLSWRCWLEDNGVQQPFKQAHREVYVLTGAERETRTHSNRFAAHILRQHQFAALCRQRQWRYNLMGAWDSHNIPFLDLPDAGLQVQLFVDFASEDDQTAHGIYEYVATDQVRFVDAETQQARPLESIPPLLFSEVMRDVDLFVGVCSVGADPHWGPGRNDAFDNYWERVSFGDLSGAGETRRDLLERLLPRLAIAEKSRLDGRFLVVEGQRATYKIHLGSGNILMEPGSRYLCIVPGPATSKNPRGVMLPFDEDRLLSVILSKAFLLAEDTKIKDPAILEQLPPVS